MKHKKVVCLSLAASVFPMLGKAEAAEPKNVLLLCVDDLRPVLGCYGGAAKTPNLDRLAQSAAVFTRHYVQWPVCGPSRASMLSSLYPDTTGIYENSDAGQIVQHPDTWPTMPLWFKTNGYTTLSFGKVYHANGSAAGAGWSEPAWQPAGHWTCYVNHTAGPNWNLGPVYEIYDGSDSLHNDYQTADQVIAALTENQSNRFFIAGGFLKPHLPFVAPQGYWDSYAPEEIQQLDPAELPEGAADFMYNWSELAAYTDQQGNQYEVGGLMPDEQETLNIIRAYYACVSFTDAQIGRVLDALDQLGLSDSTAVVVWGDHGFHLGDHARWAKRTQFEQAMRSPLMMRLPSLQHVVGNVPALTESVDIYPTLCEYVGLDTPSSVEGRSLAPVLTGLDQERAVAHSQIRPMAASTNNHLMGYSFRTENFRYVEWRDTTNGNQTVYTELYDHRTDPEESNCVTVVFEIPESWMSQYGLPTNSSTDFADTDEDGMVNYDEWRAGTDPTNALSFFTASHDPSADPGSGFRIYWNSLTSRTYRIELSTNLLDSPAFQPLQSGIQGEAGVTEFIDTNAVTKPAAFYRIIIE